MILSRPNLAKFSARQHIVACDRRTSHGTWWQYVRCSSASEALKWECSCVAASYMMLSETSDRYFFVVRMHAWTDRIWICMCVFFSKSFRPFVAPWQVPPGATRTPRYATAEHRIYLHAEKAMEALC